MLSRHCRCIRHLRKLTELTQRGDKWGMVRKDTRRSTSSVSSSADNPSNRGAGALEDQASRPYTHPPFVKGLFTGQFDTERLVYPEFNTTDELTALKSRLEPIEKFFHEEVDSKAIDDCGQVPEELLNRLKEFGLFGQRIHALQGGLGLSAKEYARLSEVTSLDGSMSFILAIHQDLAVQTIERYGSEEHHERYLTDLAQGKKIAAYCLTEEGCGSDVASVQLRATMAEDGNSFILNGTKTWVTNGTVADLFVVFALTEVEVLGQKEEQVSAFLVDRSAGGISTGPIKKTLGARAAPTCDVSFENTRVPLENILGEEGTGMEVAFGVMENPRVRYGANVVGMLKYITGLATEHVINRKQYSRRLSEFPLVKEKLANLAIRTYVLESMVYLTAGIQDQYEKPDTAVEAAIVKLFAMETAWESIKDVMQLFGAAACESGHPLERRLRDAYTNHLTEGTADMLRLYIALVCLQHTGEHVAEMVNKMRNPFKNVGFSFKRRMSMMFRNHNKPRLTHKLYDHVHPTVSFSAEELEKRVHQFENLVIHCLVLYEKEIMEEQQTLEKLANIATDLFGMTAVLARVSRSKSIGLRNADHEVFLAQLFCREASDRIEKAFMLLGEGKYCNGDDMKRQVADQMFKSNGYSVEHPLERNW